MLQWKWAPEAAQGEVCCISGGRLGLGVAWAIAGTAFTNQLPTAGSPAWSSVQLTRTLRPENKIPQRLSDVLSNAAQLLSVW